MWKPAPAARGLRWLILALAAPAFLAFLVRSSAASAPPPGDHAPTRVAAATLTGFGRRRDAAQEICARRRIPLQAELGGNNAAIVWGDADLARAAAQRSGAFGFAGQRCTANRRVIVHASVREDSCPC